MRRFVLALAMVFLPATALAQSSEARIEEARDHFIRGEELYEADDFAESLTEFEIAYDLMEGHPNRGMVLYNTARCHDRLRQHAEALEDYRRSLVEASGDAPYRDDARLRIEELRAGLEAGDDAREPDPPDLEGGEESRSEGSIANWLVAGGFVAAAIPAIAIPSWTLATDGECIDADMLGCRERVRLGATDGVLFGLAGLAITGAVVFAAAQPIQVEIRADSRGAYA